ncbi:MAG: flagellar basal body protein, partial [Pseudolabrys sp.]
MGLTQALATSLSGLKVSQTGLSVVAGNVANAQTPGYVAQSVGQESTTSGDVAGQGVRVTSINRVLDTFLQQQLRTESAGGAYADKKASFYQQLQQVYGQPGSDTSFDAAFNNFTTAAQALSTSPSSFTAQDQTLSAAQNL